MAGFVHGAAQFIPRARTIAALRKAIPACRGCDLFEYATQAVFGEGPDSSPVVFVGEQPGDKEDRSGRPFVGPAGRILDQALTDAGLPRSEVYLTNAVKHFKFTERGKRRLHQKPNALEIRSCSPWLEAELHLIKPRILVCLGATAALTVFGPDYRLTKSRGQFVEHAWAQHATSTIHPSAILRSRDAETRQLEYDRFVEDLRKVRSLL